jgi:hypothetical protein
MSATSRLTRIRRRDPMTCLERIEAMLGQYVAAAWVLGVPIGSAAVLSHLSICEP